MFISSIKLMCYGLLGTNTPAYLAYSKVTAVKRFITLAPGFNGIKLFTSIIY